MKLNFALAQQPLESVFLSKKQHQFAISICLVFLGVVLIAIATQIAIPLSLTSMSLLDMAVFFCAMALGPRLTCLILIIYYVLGSLGAPIFANGQSGITLLLGFNLGYHIGLIFSAMLTGYLIQHGWGRHFITSFLAGAIGMSIFLFFGAALIARYKGWDFAWAYGIAPFIEMSLLKIILLSVVIPQVWNVVETVDK